jgi:hypothetical protein
MSPSFDACAPVPLTLCSGGLSWSKASPTPLPWSSQRWEHVHERGPLCFFGTMLTSVNFPAYLCSLGRPMMEARWAATRGEWLAPRMLLVYMAKTWGVVGHLRDRHEPPSSACVALCQGGTTSRGSSVPTRGRTSTGGKPPTHPPTEPLPKPRARIAASAGNVFFDCGHLLRYWRGDGTESNGTSRTFGAPAWFGVLDPTWSEPAYNGVLLHALQPLMAPGSGPTGSGGH